MKKRNSGELVAFSFLVVRLLTRLTSCALKDIRLPVISSILSKSVCRKTKSYFHQSTRTWQVCSHTKKLKATNCPLLRSVTLQITKIMDAHAPLRFAESTTPAITTTVASHRGAIRKYYRRTGGTHRTRVIWAYINPAGNRMQVYMGLYNPLNLGADWLKQRSRTVPWHKQNYPFEHQ